MLSLRFGIDWYFMVFVSILYLAALLVCIHILNTQKWAAGFTEPAVTAAYTHLYKKTPWSRIVPKVFLLYISPKFFAKMDE